MSLNQLAWLELSDHLYLPDLQNMKTRVGSGIRYTLGEGGGRAVLRSVRLLNGQLLKLVDSSELGAFTGLQVDVINEFKASGEEVVFKHHRGSWRVTVEETDLKQTDGYANPDENDLYSGSVSLRIVAKL